MKDNHFPICVTGKLRWYID